MYDDLIKRLQEDKPSRRMMLTSADAIEELCGLCASLSKDCSEAVAEGRKLMIPWIFADLDMIIDNYSEPPKEEEA